jgi:hypothetical protein
MVPIVADPDPRLEKIIMNILIIEYLNMLDLDDGFLAGTGADKVGFEKC